MTFPGGLLAGSQSAMARLLAQMQPQPQPQPQPQGQPQQPPPQAMPQGMPQPTPPWNPNANPVQAGMQSLLSQNLSQNPVQGEGPGLLAQPPQDDAHNHRKGPLGLLSHAIGADRTPPELRALLTDEQAQRAQPGLISSIGNFLIRGRTPQQVQMERAATMIGLQDKKVTRDKAERDRRVAADIEQSVGKISADPAIAQQQLEQVARMRGAAGLDDASLTAQRVAPPVFAPRAPQPVRLIKTDEKTGRRYLAERQPGADVSGDVFVSWMDPEKRDTSVADAARLTGRSIQLQARYQANPVVKQAQLLASAFQSVQAAAERSNPQSNLALMYAAVQMRDPNAVKEGEIALQREARSIPGWLLGYWDRVAKGNLLTDKEREQIVEWAGEKIIKQRELIDPIRESYRGQAKRTGLSDDADWIAFDPFEGITLAPAAPVAANRPQGFKP